MDLFFLNLQNVKLSHKKLIILMYNCDNIVYSYKYICFSILFILFFLVFEIQTYFLYNEALKKKKNLVILNYYYFFK